MRCGAKCFLVEVHFNGKVQTIRVTARTPVGARKIIRGKFGPDSRILSVREKKR